MHIIEKVVGETPHMALERLRGLENIPADVPLAYAGRLDPMASGKLLVLVGDECKDQKEYQGIDKDYEIEVLLGASTDTGDILGVVENSNSRVTDLEELRSAIKSFKGVYDAPYPAYSSRTVDGKPLFQWALLKRLHEIRIPLQRGTIHRIEVMSIYELTKPELEKVITEKLALVPLTDDPRKVLGKNFRIEEVRASWKDFFATTEMAKFQIARIHVETSSGVYMRTLADDIAHKVHSVGLALKIHRSKLHLP